MPKPTAARPSLWPTNSVCARSRSIATAASARCIPRSVSGSRPALHVCVSGASSAHRASHAATTSCFPLPTRCGIHTPWRHLQGPHYALYASGVEGGLAMTFEEILDLAIAMLQRRGRLTYGTLKRQFQLDDAALEDLKNELIEGQRLAVDERGNVLVWTGGADP